MAAKTKAEKLQAELLTTKSAYEKLILEKNQEILNLKEKINTRDGLIKHLEESIASLVADRRILVRANQIAASISEPLQI